MTEATQVLTLKTDKKKFFIKRKGMREADPEKNSSIFKITSLNEMSMTNQNAIDTLKQYQTVSIEGDHSYASYHSVNKPKIKSSRETELPKITLKSKHLQHTASTGLQTGNSTEEAKIRLIPKLSMAVHEHDPVHVRNQIDIDSRVMKKYAKYKKNWLEKMVVRRKGKSLVQRSLERAEKSIHNINIDANKRKNTTNFDEMLRNNISQKTFIFPAQHRPQIIGLKGKGGRSIPIFEQIYQTEQIYKFNKEPV